jgi:hypothetical protein
MLMEGGLQLAERRPRLPWWRQLHMLQPQLPRRRRPSRGIGTELIESYSSSYLSMGYHQEP